MEKPAYRLLLAAVAVVFVATGARHAPGPIATEKPVLTRIDHTVVPDRTHVVFDLSARTHYEIRSYDNPDRVAVNLPGVGVEKSLQGAAIDAGVVRRIRINRLSWGTQVVFDLRSQATWSDLYLQPVDDMPDRIVVDLAERGAAGATVGAPESAGRAVVAVKEPSPRRAAAPAGEEEERVFVVAVDAGHGGRDVGAKGKYNLVEKHLALDIARRVARTIDGTKGFKAVLTRDRDVFLDLVERTRTAKRKGADVFVSIHLNSAPRKTARGIEVWFISPAGAEATARRLLSNREAAAHELGLEKPESSDIMHMLVDVNQQAMMQRSFLLAEEILTSVDRVKLPPVRSVKQQSFAVLKSIDMPSVLVEAGFLSNSKDAAFVKTNEGKQAIAEAVAAGVVSFLKKYPPAPSAKGRVVVHRVKKGETLWRISRRYNTTVASIRDSNRLGESDVLRVGQELVIRERHDNR